VGRVAGKEIGDCETQCTWRWPHQVETCSKYKHVWYIYTTNWVDGNNNKTTEGRDDSNWETWGWVGRGLYPGAVSVEPRWGHWLSWLWGFVVFHSPLIELRPLPSASSFEFVSHSTIRRYTDGVVKQPPKCNISRNCMKVYIK
jgi:hypothetical protein